MKVKTKRKKEAAGRLVYVRAALREYKAIGVQYLRRTAVSHPPTGAFHAFRDVKSDKKGKVQAREGNTTSSTQRHQLWPDR